MGLRAWNVGVLVAIASLWLASGTQREKAVLELGAGAGADSHANDAGNVSNAGNAGNVSNAGNAGNVSNVSNAGNAGNVSNAGNAGSEARARASSAAANVRGLEVQVSMNPADAVRRRELAQAYLDARAPGLAIRVVESAPASARANPTLEHVYARALIDQGRSTDALAAEQRVLATCSAEDASETARPDGAARRPCDTWLLASATRRSEILRQLVELGVDDALAHPETSAIAYHNATREAKLALQ